MKQSSKQLNQKRQSSDQLEALMRNLETQIDPSAAVAGSCRRMYCTP
jgi:hypothetical protein